MNSGRKMKTKLGVAFFWKILNTSFKHLKTYHFQVKSACTKTNNTLKILFSALLKER